MYGNKRKSTGDGAGTAKKRLETKVKMINRVEWDKKMVVVACSYNMNHSTTGKIVKNKHTIMKYVKSAVPMMLTII